MSKHCGISSCTETGRHGHIHEDYHPEWSDPSCPDCRIHNLEAELVAARADVERLKNSIIDTVGGVDYEGFPTSELNYLQRLRILVEKEARLVELSECWKFGFVWLEDELNKLRNCGVQNCIVCPPKIAELTALIKRANNILKEK